MKTDMLVGKYVELRDRRAALKKSYEAEDKVLKDMMEKIEEALHKALVAAGETSKKTRFGIVFKTKKEFANAADWDAVTDYIWENKAWGLITRRINVAEVKSLMEPDETGKFTKPPPPGVNFVQVETVGIRRA